MMPDDPLPDSSSVRLGGTGSGKSFDLLYLFDEWLKAGKSVLAADSKGTTVRRAYANAVAAGYGDRCLYVKLASPYIVGMDLRPMSHYPDPYQRRLMQNRFNGNFKQIFIASQNKDTDRDEPWKQEAVDDIIQLVARQRVSKPIEDLFWGLDLGSPQFARLMRDYDGSDPDLKRKFEADLAAYRRNPRDVELRLGAGRRRLRPVLSPLFRATDSALTKLDVAEGQRRGMHLYLDGSDIEDEEYRAYVLAVVLKWTSEAEDTAVRTGETPGLMVVLEEAGASQLTPEFLVSGMMTQREWAIYYSLCSQSYLDLGDKAPRILQNARLLKLFRSASREDLRDLSELLTMYGWDSFETHFERQRALSKGPKAVKLTDVSRSRNDGKQVQLGTKDRKSSGTSTTESERTTFINEQEIVTDATYKDPNLKRHERAHEIATLLPGEHFEVFDGAVRKQRRPMIVHPWDDTVTFRVDGLEGEKFFPSGRATLYQYRLRLAIERQWRTNPLFTRVSWNPHQTDGGPSSPPPSGPAPIPTPRTPGGGRGMRRSGG